jgi:hypothetical protein
MENVISTSQQLVMSWNHDLGSLRIAFLSHRSARHSTTAQGPGERSGEASSAATIHRGSTPGHCTLRNIFRRHWRNLHIFLTLRRYHLLDEFR